MDFGGFNYDYIMVKVYKGQRAPIFTPIYACNMLNVQFHYE